MAVAMAGGMHESYNFETV